jgi:ABC-type glycerol-3-phosphate transport system substrate-binding protein
VLVAQYLGAGGKLIDVSGKPALERTPLISVLSFYERAQRTGLISDKALDFASATQYMSQFLAGNAAAAQIESSVYLTLRDTDTTRLAVSALPMPGDGQTSVAVVDGWLWAVVERDSAQKSAAIALLRQLLADEWYSRYCREMNVLPAYAAALRLWPENKYTDFLLDLLTQPAVQPMDTLDTTLVTALLTAFEDVVAGRQSAEAAADAAIAQLNN